MLARAPWTPPIEAPPPKRLRDRVRRQMIDATAALMRAAWEAGLPSRLALEAPCRIGIRSGLCEQGWM